MKIEAARNLKERVVSELGWPDQLVTVEEDRKEEACVVLGWSQGRLARVTKLGEARELIAELGPASEGAEAETEEETE